MIVNMLVPSIQADLDLSDANLQWIVNAYALFFGGFLLLGGRAGDLLGRKRALPDRPSRLQRGLAARRRLVNSGMLIASRVRPRVSAPH